MGSSGDIMPSIGIGWELRRRGYPVTVITNPWFASLVDEAGLDFIAVGVSADYERFMADGDVFDRNKKGARQIIQEYLIPVMETYYETCMDCLVPGESLLLQGEFGATTAAEKLGIPVVSVAPAPATSHFNSRYDPIHPERLLPTWAQWFAGSGRRLAWLYRLNDFRRGVLRRNRSLPASITLLEDNPLAVLRKRAGLSLEMSLKRQKVLCMWPEWFAPPQPDWPKEMEIAGFPLFATSNFAGRDYARDLPEAEKKRPIVFSTGSLASSHREFYSLAIEACELLQQHSAILLTPNEDHIPRNLPDYIHHVRHAPLKDLFDRASMVVHHGGIGTSSFAIAAGIPQLVMPLRGDQFDNGNRLTRLGVARMISPRQSSSVLLARTIAALLNSDQVAERCRHWQSRIEPEEGLKNAANCIEKIARQVKKQ